MPKTFTLTVTKRELEILHAAIAVVMDYGMGSVRREMREYDEKPAKRQEVSDLRSDLSDALGGGQHDS